MLRRQRAIEIVPGSKPLRWRRYDVPQHLAPKTSDALRFCAVESDLELLDRRHRSTIEAGSFVVSTGPPRARLWRKPLSATRRRLTRPSGSPPSPCQAASPSAGMSPDTVRAVLDACARRLDGRPAAAATTRRKCAVLAHG